MMCKFCGIVRSIKGIGFTQRELDEAKDMGITFNSLEKRIYRGHTKQMALRTPPQKQRNVKKND
jgi:hypothetical protein